MFGRYALDVAARRMGHFAGTLVNSATTSRAARHVGPNLRHLADGRPAARSMASRAPKTRASASATMVPKKVDDQLAASLAKEEAYENEANECDDVAETEGNQPGSLNAILKQFEYNITDKRGCSEVVLTREMGTEKVNVTFSIDDVNTAMDEDEMYADDSNYESVSLVITVTKANAQGALTFQGTAEKDGLIISNIVYSDDPANATATTAEADYARRGLYMGPGFETLEDDIQTSFKDYLAARGIDDELAKAVLEYSQRKEEQEYRIWLSNVHKFIKSA